MSGEPKKIPEGRKQWNRFNSRTPVQIYDGYLAEDGCPDSQAVLGKQLLEGKLDESVDQEQNDRLGVYWLIKASEQGHKEATKMLEKCLKTGRGITKHNIGDVTTCLKMSHEEKVSRHAARVLFTSLSQGTDFITSEQLFEAMQGAQKNRDKSKNKNTIQKTDEAHSSSSDNDWLSQVNLTSCEKLSEDMLVAAASNHSRGELPIVHRVLMLNNKTRSHQSNSTFLQNSVFSPIRSIYSSYEMCIHTIGKQPVASYFPSKSTCLQSLIILAIYSVGFNSIIDALPSLVYFTSLAIMIITTCQILTKKWEFNEFKQWSNLLVTWGGQDVNAEGAEMAHCYNNIYPCYMFICSLITNIILSQFVSEMIIPYSELAVLSTIFAFVMLYNFAWHKDKFDYIALFSFGVSALAKQNPYDSESVASQSLSFLNLFIPTFITSTLGDFNFSILMYVVMVGLLWRMAVRDQKHGIYRTFLPHLVSLSWWHVAIVASNGATTFGLIRSCLVVVVAVLILPLAGLAILLLPIVAVVKFLIATDEALFESTTLAAACLCNLALMYFGTRRSRAGKIISKVQVGLGLLSAGLLLFSAFANSPMDTYNQSASLTWKQYQETCSPHDAPTRVSSQMKCASLSGLQVHWEGIVQSTTITNSYNPLATVVGKLPNWMQNIVSCMYGERYSTCDGNDGESCPLPELFTKCHLANWNRYDYEIVVKMSTGTWDTTESRAYLKAGNMFTNFTQELISGDKIWFSGSLEFQPGAESNPHLWLHQAGCLSCSKLLHPYVTGSPQFTIYTPLHALEHFIGFIFNPNFSF